MTIVDNIKILTSQFILKKPGLGEKNLRKQGKKPQKTAAREEQKKAEKNQQQLLMTFKGGTG